MVSDGMGPASLSLTRTFRQYVEELDYSDILNLDKHFIGASRTRSSDSPITDSAAGATAFSCGKKSYNNAVGVLPDHNACGTILESAKLHGMMTGLVVTTRITDATPAAFSSHANYRWEEDLIAQHQLGYYPLGRMVDLIIGGGRCHFLPKFVPGGCRNDDHDLVKKAQKSGWNYVDNKQDFDKLNQGKNVTLPLLALLADGDIPFDLDRDDKVYPSLAETAQTAIRALEEATKDSEHGFFLLIEGSRIDHAGHQNDPSAQVREVLAYDAAFKAAIDFAESSDVETIVISTSDHETGGLATAKQLTPEYPEYIWYPEALANASHSGEFLSLKLKNVVDYSEDKLTKFITEEILENGLGVYDYSDEEISRLIENKNNAQDVINNIVSVRSQTGWSTHGHSAVDVNIYGYSKKNTDAHISLMESLVGNHENIEIGKFMESWLELDLDAVSKKLNSESDKEITEFGQSWTGSMDAESLRELRHDNYHI
ncbi:alkaline phosphatase-like protein [Nadsonia fulvescens var. elongata DSM 6958]|uniref:Alkaline phosphatase n=1 Tax=Nadsonia fulvescens var. elongata DSM 6958 TaxID=857566 RepID=A0A1E3PLM5_9ASCO|nr:alkaline phosphatase-like protein [Nadsonia fulvescens var. elongata DSM 6958]